MRVTGMKSATSVAVGEKHTLALMHSHVPKLQTQTTSAIPTLRKSPFLRNDPPDLPEEDEVLEMDMEEESTDGDDPEDDTWTAVADELACTGRTTSTGSSSWGSTVRSR